MTDDITPYPGLAADLRAELDHTGTFRNRALVEARLRLRAALAPEPCGAPGRWFTAGNAYLHEGQHKGHEDCAPLFTCSLPKSHHAPQWTKGHAGTDCCDKSAGDPVHSGDRHQVPDEVWA